MRLFLITSLFLTIFYSNAQNIAAKDSIYQETVKTVQFYTNTQTHQTSIVSPVLEKNKGGMLTLEFDILKEEIDYFTMRIYAYNYDWTESSFLMSNDYLEEYNEFNISSTRNSFNTRIAYLHYTANIPAVLESGNFLVVVYDDEENIILSRRFMIFKDAISVDVESGFGQNFLNQATQQFNFKIQIPSYLLNPARQIKIVVRQNNHWDKCKTFTTPTYLNATEFTYRLYKDEHSFIAGNEYRVFDSRSIRFKGNRIADIVLHEKINSIFLLPDVSRFHHYLTMNDINGLYLIDHYEYGDGTVNADYLLTNFFLKSEELLEPIYVYGALSDWKLKDDFRMRYDNDKKMYYCSPMLKQGYYNYQYVTLSNEKINAEKIEGSHSQTENGYEIFIYYKNQSNIDELIGYKKFSINP